MAVVEEGAAPGVILFDSNGNILSSGTTLSGATITDGGSMIVADKGTAEETTVSSGGKMYVSSGGMASDTEVLIGGSMLISSGGLENITGSGSLVLSYGCTLDDETKNKFEKAGISVTLA